MTWLGAMLLAASAGWLLPAAPRHRLRRVQRRGNHASAVPTRRRVWPQRAPGEWSPWAARRAARRRREAVVELCQALATELQGGSPPREAVVAAADGLDTLRPLVTTARTPYADVAAALARLAELPGAGGLAHLAACWRVCDQSGAGLAGAVARLAEGLRNDEAARREASAQLAGTKATAVLLAVLPVFALAMGAAMGARPLDLLLGTPLGLLLLGTALVLELLGLLWTASITRRVLPR